MRRPPRPPPDSDGDDEDDDVDEEEDGVSASDEDEKDLEAQAEAELTPFAAAEATDAFLSGCTTYEVCAARARMSRLHYVDH
jgi:hypothetical protein